MAAARTGGSGKPKLVHSASSTAEAAGDETVETAAAHSEGVDEQAETSDEQPETIAAHHPEHSTEHAEPVAAQTESVAAPVAAQVESVPERAEAAATTSAAGAASPQACPAATDTRDEKPRFRIFVIDSGWNHPAGKVLNENIELIHALTHEDPIYILDRDKSVALLRKNKSLIGHDPIIAVHDVTATGISKHLGFRLHLGLLDDETQCLSSQKMFARFINTHRDAKDLEADVRRKLH